MTISPIWTKAKYICSMLLTGGGEMAELVAAGAEVVVLVDIEDTIALLVCVVKGIELDVVCF